MFKLRRRINKIREVIGYFNYGNSDIVKIRSKFSKIDRARDILIKFYKQQPNLVLPKPNKVYDSLSSTSKALGDCISSITFTKAAKLQNKKKFFETRNPYNWQLIPFNPYYVEGRSSNVFPLEKTGEFDFGNGNLAQQFSRILGLVPEVEPGNFLVTNQKRIKNRIGICLKTGKSAFFKRDYQEPRQLYLRNVGIFQEFINENPTYEFCEFGTERFGFKNVTNYCGLNVSDSINLASTCSHFFCLNSGFLHVANALGINCTTIINIPRLNQCFLPILKPFSVEDLAWLHIGKRNNILHQDGSNGLVEEFSLRSLNKSLSQEVYPYGTNEFNSLLFGK